MKGFARFMLIIGELFAAVIIVPFLGALLAAAVAFPVLGIPMLLVIGIYVGCCYMLNKAVCDHDEKKK